MFGFGKKKKEEPKRPPPDLNNVSLNLSNKMNDMALKIQQTDKELRAQLTIMRTSGNPTAKAQAKKKATQLLKKKKMYENHYNNLSGTQMTVDSANVECQMMKDNLDIVRAMKDTVDVQKQTMKEMGGIDSMYDIMDEMAEIKEEQEEMNQEFQRNYDVDVGDEELEAELDALDYQMRADMDNSNMNAPQNQFGSQVKNDDEIDLEDALK
jgi:hypothetical protein